MNFGKTIAALIIAAALQNPCAVNAADEDRELSLIAAEQENTGDEKLDELNPALTETISTERKEDTDKERRERRKKLRETRREKERENERKLRDSTRKKDAQTLFFHYDLPPRLTALKLVGATCRQTIQPEQSVSSTKT